MRLLTKITKRLHDIASDIENPRIYRLRRYGGIPDIFQNLNRPWFQALRIASVLDIGANIGQFAISINAVLSEAQICSFEPLPDCFAELQVRMKHARHFAAFNVGLGDRSGTLSFERNASTASSSFLKMTDIHKAAFPFTRDSQQTQVRMERLDDIAQQLNLKDPMLVKIDVQGYEDRVLSGGQQTIQHAKVVIIETTFAELYDGQPLFDDIYRILTSWGFAYAGSLNQLVDPRDGKILQADSIFVKQS